MTEPLMAELTNPPAPTAPIAAPSVEQRHGKPWSRFVLEVVLISAGVFLGLAGDQWREDAEHRQLARSTMERFRTELTANRQAVRAVQEYRVDVLAQLRAYLAKPHASRNVADVRLRGLQFTSFEETAWDLALATQSLSYLDGDLAAKLSRVYTAQHRIEELSHGLSQAMYLINTRENFDGLASAAEIYFSDMVVMEPALLKQYDDALASLSKQMGDSGAGAK
jgi:hypothetical protein